MLADDNGLENAIHQWRALPAGDRKAILQRLPSERRLAFLRLLAEAGGDTPAHAAPARRYREYSPWLADLIDGCENAGPAAEHLTPNVRAALVASHEAARKQGNGSADTRPFNAMFRRLTRWLDGLR